MAFYFGIFREPRGLIRVLQFIFAIFAFATACNGSSYLTIKDSGDKETISVAWSYPYNFQQISLDTKFNYSDDGVSTSNDIKPSAEFFVFTGVTSMLLSLAFAIIYVVMYRQYLNDERIPLIDFIITIIWTIFWIAGSSAWAQGVSNIRSYTKYEYITKLVSECSTTSNCANFESGTYANITVSVIFGFLNFLLWLSCIWFVYKETRFFKSRSAQQQQQQNYFSNIAGPSMQYPPETKVPGTMG